MLIEASVTAISWIPSEAVEGMPKLPFALGIGRYDDPPPDRLYPGDLTRLRDENQFREANVLRAWAEAQDGRIVAYGNAGHGLVGATAFSLGSKTILVPGVGLETLRPEPEAGNGWVRFVQSVGGRDGFPIPRRVSGRPYWRVQSATAWTTLALTIRADGSCQHELVGASSFPRHWIYDGSGALVAKAGTVSFKSWLRTAHGGHTPWGDEQSEAFVTAAESALERQLSREVMRAGRTIGRRTLAPGETLVEQGDRSDEIFLLLDGIVMLEIDGEPQTEFGPGAILGELAGLEGGRRTATLRACTRSRAAVIAADALDRDALDRLAEGRTLGR